MQAINGTKNDKNDKKGTAALVFDLEMATAPISVTKKLSIDKSSDEKKNDVVARLPVLLRSMETRKKEPSEV